MDFVYDIEVLPNVFTCTALNTKTGRFIEFEISPRKNEFSKFIKWIQKMRLNNCRMVGFNNLHYDYPVIHYMLTELINLTGAKILTSKIYEKSCAIFESTNHGFKFAHTVWDSDHIIPQIDLFKIHHFDNPAKSTSLKRLQFNMRLKSIQEFDTPFGEPVKKSSTIKGLLDYNRHDVASTNEFREVSLQQIDFREQMTQKYEKNFLNHNDTKIGEDYLTLQLSKRVGDHILYVQTENGRRIKRSSPRDVVPIDSFIFDYIHFDHPSFVDTLEKLKTLNMFVIRGKFHWNEHDDYPKGYEKIQKIRSAITKQGQLVKSSEAPIGAEATLNHLIKRRNRLTKKYDNYRISCQVDDFVFEFGKGGIHGARKNSVYRSNRTHVLLDVDVTSMYPSVGIENELYPEHLTKAFCPIYAEQKKLRLKYDKKSIESAMLKLALNGAYGKTNSKYSVFYDPLYTMSTTINGQLLLCMLWDRLRVIDDIEIVQANTDGITFYINRKYVKQAGKICREWQKITKLQLEQSVYKQMFIRDVNNYICEYKDGSIKAKGAYLYKSLYHEKGIATGSVEWHKNHSMLVVQKAVEAELIRGVPAHKFIIEHDNVYDFFLCTNVNKASRLILRYEESEEPCLGTPACPVIMGDEDIEIQRVSRYLISNHGRKLIKIMPPLKGKTQEQEIGINVGYRVHVCNDVKSEDVCNYDINYQFYIDEAEKLLKPFRGK